MTTKNARYWIQFVILCQLSILFLMASGHALAKENDDAFVGLFILGMASYGGAIFFARRAP